MELSEKAVAECVQVMTDLNLQEFEDHLSVFLAKRVSRAITAAAFCLNLMLGASFFDDSHLWESIAELIESRRA